MNQNPDYDKYPVLLVSPPLHDFYFTPARLEPLGLLYLAEALRRDGFDKVDVLDAASRGKTKRMAWPPEMDYLSTYYHEDESCFSLLNNWQRRGISDTAIVRAIKEGEYRLVGISAMFSAYVPDLSQLVQRIRTECGDIFLVAGGWAVEAEPQRLLEELAVDAVIIGSAESSLPLLARSLCSGRATEIHIPGVMMRGAVGSPAQNNNAIPEWFPRRDPEQQYRFQGLRSAKVIMSRGCPYRCGFCAVGSTFPFSERSLDSIAEELKYLYDSGVRLVDIEDDNLFHDRGRSRQLLQLLRDYHERGMQFAAMNGINASHLRGLVDECIEAGFIEFNLSMVSASSAAAKAAGRPFEPQIVREVIDEIGGRARTLVFLIGGLPGTTVSGTIDAICEMAAMPLTIGFSPLYVLPETRLAEQVCCPATRRLARGSALHAFPEGFSRESVASLWKMVRMINAIKEKPLAATGSDREYFVRSIRKGVWHARGKDGVWRETFSFDSSSFRRLIRIRTLDGEFIELDVR